MKRILLILILSILPAFSMLARETVKGIVVDAHGDPIPGVRVEIPGKNEFVFTDLDGAFQIVLREPTKKLQFSYPGFSPSTYRVRPEMTVVLGKGWAGHEKGGRVMYDLEGGMGFNGKATFKSGNLEVRDIQTFVMPGITITPGYQFNRHLFVGIGTGAYLDFVKYEEIEKYNYNSAYESWLDFPLVGVHVPLYLTARWDFGLTKKTAPYVDLRVGYIRFFKAGESGELSYMYEHGNNYSSYFIVDQVNHGSFFIAPSIGYRVNIYKKFGMNFGIRYMAGMKKKYSATTEYSNNYNTEITKSYEFIQRASDVLLFNIGFDF